MRRPQPLRKGDVIAVYAPAGPVDGARLRRGMARLSAAGFVPEVADGVLAAEGYLAGCDAHRARQLEWALALPEARAAMAARGGYGTTRLLPRIDWRSSRGARSCSWVQRPHRHPRVRLHAPEGALHPRPDDGGGPRHAVRRGGARRLRAAGGGTVSPREPWGEPMERLRAGGAGGGGARAGRRKGSWPALPLRAHRAPRHAVLARFPGSAFVPRGRAGARVPARPDADAVGPVRAVVGHLRDPRGEDRPRAARPPTTCAGCSSTPGSGFPFPSGTASPRGTTAGTWRCRSASAPA